MNLWTEPGKQNVYIYNTCKSSMNLKLNLKPNKKKILYSLLGLILLSLFSYMIITYLNNHFFNLGVCTASYPARCSNSPLSFSGGLIISILITIVYYLTQSYFDYKKLNN